MLQAQQKETPSKSAFPGQVDDVSDDAAAAFTEVMERTARETVEPVAKARAEPEVRKGEKDDGDDPAVSKTEAGKRDERGRFAADKSAKSGAPDDKGSKEIADKAQDAADKGSPASAEPAEGVTKDAPPSSWSVKAKLAWDSLPADIKTEVAKRETEVGQGFAALRDYKDLKPWAEMASAHGTTINKALERYVGIENVLKRDVGAGISLIAENCGLSQPQAAQLFANLAQRFGGQAPQANGQPQPGAVSDPLMDMLNPVLNPLMTELHQLKSQLSQRDKMEQGAQERSLSSEIESFAADPANRYFPNVEATVTKLFESKMVPLTGNAKADLKKAYELAIRMTPDIQEALIEQRLEEARQSERKVEQDRVAKAKGASRSMSGTRTPGTVIKDVAADDGQDDVEAEVRRAYRLHARS